VVGTLGFEWALAEQWKPAKLADTLELRSGGAWIAYPAKLPKLDLDFRHLSPVSFGDVQWQAGRPSAQAPLTPTIPLLNAPLQVTLLGDDLRFGLTYSAGELRLPIPGVTIEDAAVSVFYSTLTGFGAEGSLDFALPRLGSGRLTVGATSRRGFEAQGAFSFDPGLFDRSEIQVWYREGAFGAAGEIGIDSPERVRGIRSAALRVRIDAQGFAAEGEVQPAIPGVQQAGLQVTYGEATGLCIGGTLELAPNPALHSGSVAVTVRRPAEGGDDARWVVQARGRAVPAIPGLASELQVTYDDGAFDARFAGAFERGMLRGTIEAGASNRTLDASGLPTGPAAPPGAPLVVYGSGSATVRLAPWLQGTAGVRVHPDGHLSLAGEIGIPNALTIFERRSVDKRLFGVSARIPIVPGIVAEFGGNLSAQAGLGPGLLEQCRIGIQYDPEREADTTVTGDARLRVPADAGLRLAARAGIGLGIPGVSATGGLELGAALGVAGAAEAAVHIEWRPGSGLAIDAEASVHAEPRFRFDVSGYVTVEALFFTVYDERFELAAFEAGSGLRFGVRFPIRYREGEPFSVSLDDVQFEVPPVDPMQAVRDVIAQIA
jgi:hypothetical protein